MQAILNIVGIWSQVKCAPSYVGAELTLLQMAVVVGGASTSPLTLDTPGKGWSTQGTPGKGW
jgi:hypothetical protein